MKALYIVLVMLALIFGAIENDFTFAAVVLLFGGAYIPNGRKRHAKSKN